MKLAFPFIQLPLKFDAAALGAELSAVDEREWLAHPQGFAGNSMLPLVAVNGDPHDDGVAGPMRPTSILPSLPLINQVIESLGCVLGRTRLMRLSGNSEVKPHIDQGYYWTERMRVHVPIVTTPGVRFYCGDAAIHMAAGEAWIFDTWRLHRVQNDGDLSRVHLVVDTIGGDGLWNLLGKARPSHVPAQGWPVNAVNFSDATPNPLDFETYNLPVVMSPWELRTHIGFVFNETLAHPSLVPMQHAARDFLRRWQALWTIHGEHTGAIAQYRHVLDAFVAEVKRLGVHILLKNGLSLSDVMQAMVTKAALAGGKFAPDRPSSRVEPSSDPIFDRPVFIVSSPRAGSTLLFETLAKAPHVFTIGDESHGIFEGIPALHPSARDFASNCLDADDASPAVVAQLRDRFATKLRDRDGASAGAGPVRMLEKTPKNALRIPFLAKAFPEAHFIYLYRDPRETLASMIEAWKSGTFKTYRDLPGWGADWSLLLVPGWRELGGKPLPEIVAAQWETATRILLDDLAALPSTRFTVARYDNLIGNPADEIARVCKAVDFGWDAPIDAALPASRYTVSAPNADKWRKYEVEITSVLPQLQATAARAADLSRRS